MSDSVDAGRLIKIGENGYVRERGDFLDISEDGNSGRTYISAEKAYTNGKGIIDLQAQLDNLVKAANNLLKWNLDERMLEVGLLREAIKAIEEVKR